MSVRLKAVGLHLIASGIVLGLVIATFYLLWYRWPGWYLADVSHVAVVFACVDLVAGPLLTGVVASPRKPRRELARDVSVIVVIQLSAMIYGSLSLWHGRPLYYAFSEDVLQLVQAYDIDEEQLAHARAQQAPLMPHWYSMPRWIWAPLPDDPTLRQQIMASAVSGGDDVISMPIYYRDWQSGVPGLRSQLKRVDDCRYFSKVERDLLKQRMQEAGLAWDRADTMAMLGRGRPLLAVIDPETVTIRQIFAAH